MSPRIVSFVFVSALTIGGLLAGCDRPAPSATAPGDRGPVAAPTTKERDVRVRTPGAAVDVTHDPDGRLKVDVRAKGTTGR
ncbi:MAG TPA: hypothetical protein VH092_35410 [Urbifossiella sp.]|jgi:hypothetical protein|nr:hypothetical protein [Urbifossiella sp.]